MNINLKNIKLNIYCYSNYIYYYIQNIFIILYEKINKVNFLQNKLLQNENLPINPLNWICISIILSKRKQVGKYILRPGDVYQTEFNYLQDDQRPWLAIWLYNPITKQRRNIELENDHYTFYIEGNIFNKSVFEYILNDKIHQNEKCIMMDNNGITNEINIHDTTKIIVCKLKQN